MPYPIILRILLAGLLITTLAACHRDSDLLVEEPILRDGEVGLRAASYQNPVLEVSGDPAVIRVDQTYYMYLPKKAAGNTGGTVELYTASDIAGPWTFDKTVYSNVGLTYDGYKAISLYAPEVIRVAVNGTERYYLYVVNVMDGADTGKGNADIAVIQGTAPDSFDPGSMKLLLGEKARNVRFLDPSPFLDEGRLWVSYKVRDYAGNGTRIEIRECETERPHLFKPASASTFGKVLYSTDVAEAHAIVEHPYLYRRKDLYYLFYSSGQGDKDTYKIGYRTSTSITGPYSGGTDYLMYTGQSAGVVSPGATSIVRDCAGYNWMVYRQKETAAGGFGNRDVYADRLQIDASTSSASIIATRGTVSPRPVSCQ